jgi:hypothetical protein
MRNSNRLKLLPGVLLGSSIALVSLVNCSAVEDAGDVAGALCCTEFKVGGDQSNLGAELKIEGQAAAQFSVFAQAISDLSVTATAMLNDVTNACRSIAVDAGASQTDLDAAEAKGERDRAGAYCDLAVASVKAGLTASGEANATLEAVFEPPKCEASISAKAKCQGQCSGSAKCDIKANPPTCTGGKLEVSCKGECKVEGSASIACEGKCEGTCEGSCVAEGGVAVDCEGKCDGTCAAGGSANGSGAQADGTCKGTCQGTCTASATAPKIACKGQCKGSCSASCRASGTLAAKCDGKCEGDFEPISCKGGELSGGCQVEAKCEANCNASVKAKAECTPPRVEIRASASASANVNVDRIIASLEANLPQIIIAVQARGPSFVGSVKASVEGGASISGSLNAKASFCLLNVVVPTVQQAVTSAEASLSAAGKLSAIVKL